MTRFRDAYDRVYKTLWVEGTGHIQWKGTNVCIDIKCPCGHDAHHDGAFLYQWRCSECKQTFALDPIVKLISISAEDSDEIGCVQDEQIDD